MKKPSTKEIIDWFKNNYPKAYEEMMAENYSKEWNERAL